MFGFIKNIVDLKLLELKSAGIAQTSLFLSKILTFLVYMVLTFMIFMSFTIFISLLIGYYIESYEVSFILMFGFISIGSCMLYIFRKTIVARAMYRYVQRKLMKLIAPELGNRNF